MSVRSLMIVVLTLAFGGSAAVGVNSFLKNPPNPKGDVVSVLIAAVDMPRGGNVTSEMLKPKDYPKDMVPVGALSKPEDAIDRAIAIPLIKDEPVLDGKLSPKGAGRGMAALIPSGMRAYTIQTPNVAQGVAGFILPGNKVDILLSVNDGVVSGIRQVAGGTTTMLLQNVEILAVDQKTVAPAENKMDAKELRSVTVLVAPQQANLLTLAQTKGQLYLALRNLKDNNAARTHPATLDELRFHQELPWDERAKGVLEALGKALSQRPPAPTPVPQTPKAPPPPPTVTIRTLRAAHEGGVVVQLPQDSRFTQQSSRALDARN
jgi:pilus assembly protein CpaB